MRDVKLEPITLRASCLFSEKVWVGPSFESRFQANKHSSRPENCQWSDQCRPARTPEIHTDGRRGPSTQASGGRPSATPPVADVSAFFDSQGGAEFDVFPPWNRPQPPPPAAEAPAVLCSHSPRPTLLRIA